MNRDLYRLYNVDILTPYNKYFKFSVESDFNIDFKSMLPDYILDKYNSDVLAADLKVSELDSTYNFADLYCKHTNLMTKLQSCNINKMHYKAYNEIEKNESVKSTLRSFKPSFNKVDLPNYNLNSNVTGRLTISSGPNILTLPRKYRSIINTRFSNGKIVSVDFSSLEPRVCLSLVKKHIEGDLYEKIKEALDINVDRSVIKRAIISVLYGAHFSSLKGISSEKAERLFNSIKEFFMLDKILEMACNVDENGLRKNFFGRPLWNIKEEKEHILINNYIQSTAVDLSLTYFSDLTNQIDLQKAVPLFILHDAMIFDLNAEYENEFVNITNKGYDNPKLGHFPLDIDIFNIRKEG
jgi:DNA polymerase I-like protein with 3'-5' exonuclease and polymerase domains